MYKTKVLGIDVRAALIYVFILVASFLFVNYVQAAVPSFVQNLQEGAEGEEVANLQTFLESKGHLMMPQGVAKGYFGAKTRIALMQYQKEMGIFPAEGFFGPITRAKVLAEFGAVGTAGSPAGATVGKPVITDVKVTAKDAVTIIGSGFSTVMTHGKANTVVVGNTNKTKMLVLSQIASQFNGTRIEVILPVGWINSETLTVSVRNDSTGQISATYSGTTTAKFVDPTTQINGNSGGCISCGGNNMQQQTNAGDSSNLANIWLAIQSFLEN